MNEELTTAPATTEDSEKDLFAGLWTMIQDLITRLFAKLQEYFAGLATTTPTGE